MESWKPPCGPSRPLTDAERNSLRRWRVKDEMTHIHGLDVKTTAIGALVEIGYLDERQSEDRQAVRDALERYANETLLERASEK